MGRERKGWVCERDGVETWVNSGNIKINRSFIEGLPSMERSENKPDSQLPTQPYQASHRHRSVLIIHTILPALPTATATATPSLSTP